jgi:two-component system phosphate regulon response regulator PhoB
MELHMKKILIVDDQQEVRELVSVTLEIGSHEILTASNGSEALKIARSAHPDVILLDVMMPGGPDGIEVCRRLKSDVSTQDIYIVILTAKGQDADRQRGADAGADDYFVKPFSPLELMQKIDTVLTDQGN